MEVLLLEKRPSDAPKPSALRLGLAAHVSAQEGPQAGAARARARGRAGRVAEMAELLIW